MINIQAVIYYFRSLLIAIILIIICHGTAISNSDSLGFTNKYCLLYYSNIEEIDSLIEVLENEDLGIPEKLFILNQLSYSHRYRNPNIALEFVKRALEQERTLSKSMLNSSLHNTLGNIYFDRGEYEKAIEKYSISLGIADEQLDKRKVSHALLDIGYVYHKQGIYDLALKNFQKAAKAAMFVDDEIRLSLAYINIGQTFLQTENYDIALEYFDKALEIREKLKDSIMIMHGRTYIGLTYAAEGKFEEAFEIFNSCLKYFIRINDTYLTAYIYKYIGNIHNTDGMYNIALRYYNLALLEFKNFDSKIDIGETLLLIADVYLKDGNSIEALAYANNVYEISEEYHFLKMKKECYLMLSKIYQSRGELDRSLEYYQYYANLKDTIFSSAFSSKIADMEIQREFLIFEDEIKALHAKDKLENMALIFGLASMILVLFVGFLFYLRSRNQKKAKEILADQNRKLEEAIKELDNSQQKFEALFSKSYDAIFLIDGDKFIDCNAKALEIFKCERSEIIGKRVKDFSVPIQANGRASASETKRYLDLAYAGNPQQFFWIHAHKDGTPFDAEVSINAVTIDENIYAQAIIRDVTIKKNAEREIINAKEMAENATQSKSVFLAKMSHEIRTPLNGLINTMEILKKENLTQEQKELFQMIDSSSKSLMEIVNEILDLSKIESGNIILDKSDFHFKDLSKNIFNLFKTSAINKDINYTFNYDKTLPEVLIGDGNRTTQIISNLMSNATKFTIQGSVDLNVEKLSKEDSKVKFKITVSDTGIGIAEEQKSKILLEYVQSDETISRKYGGTGIGLNIVISIVNLMNGEFGFESVYGKGSSFWVILTYDIGKKSSIQDMEDKSTSMHDISNEKMKILIAEDNLINQKVTMINLRKSGHDVEVADNGKLAYEMFAKDHYDIILMDIQMPEMDGMEATRKIREYESKHPERRRCRIIALTANVLNRESEACFEAGMDDFISKPFRPADLQEAISKKN